MPSSNTVTQNQHSTPPLRYAELHCVSHYSFLRGASAPEELIEQADQLGYQALALTDECSVAGVVGAYRAIQDNNLGIQLIIGSEFYQDQQCYVVLAPNRQGYAELCQLISRCRRRADKGQYQFQWQDLLDLKDCLILWRCSDIEADQQILIEHFQQRLWLLAERLLDEYDDIYYDHIICLAEQFNRPVTCASDVHMHNPQRKNLQDCLVAIRHNQTVQQSRSVIFSNAERHLRSRKKLEYLYPNVLLKSTTDIADQCHFCLSEMAYHYPTDGVPEGMTASEFLRQQVELGQQQRFPKGTPQIIQKTIDKELLLIQKKRYDYYFITLLDIVNFARSKNILCQGRGSAANSIVCYCLGITEVNPTEVNLLFERFISEERHEPPDIDVDFESQRREEVIQYIYQTYGRSRAALAATVIRYRPKSALRDVGKALGLSPVHIEQTVAKFAGRYHGEHWLDVVLPVSDNPFQQNYRQLVQTILGFPRHLSQHVGGFVIADGPLDQLVPIENASMIDRTVIQWDKEDLETLGLMKVDILGLGMMSAIRRSLEQLNITMAEIPREDPAVYRMLQKADSVGVFQVESRAQMNMLPRLKPACYYDLVVQIAIVRPGPIHGDMVHPYLLRRSGKEAPDYPMEGLRSILERTYGVPLFQEQVIAFAMVAANFSASEADQLRRSMASWKRRGHMHKLQQRLHDNMLSNGFSETYIKRIQRQLEGFGEYGFPESHAASFALLVYITAWLKCHHPAIYLVALLNSQPMGFYSPAQLLEDARHHGLDILPIDIAHSDWQHETVADQASTHTPNQVRLGLRLVKGLSAATAERIIEQRHQRPFQSIADCIQRTRLNKRERQALASANAFGDLAQHRFDARWQTAQPQYDDLFSLINISRTQTSENKVRQDASEQTQLLLNTPSEFDNLQEDLASTGVSLGRHPMELMRSRGCLDQCVTTLGLRQIPHGKECYVAGLVTCRQRPGTAAGVTFLTLEDETGSCSIVVWIKTAQQQLATLLKAPIIQVYGKVEHDTDAGITHIIAHRLLDISHVLGQLNINSHDFR